MAIEQDVSLLAKGLGILPGLVARPALVVVCGLPGAGKSHFSRLLAGRVPMAVLETDVLRRRLFHRPTYSQKESHRLFQVCHLLVRHLLQQGIRVLFDATNLREQHREELYRIAEETGARLVLVWLEVPEEVVQSRLEKRAQGGAPEDHSEADWQVYQKMRWEMEPIQRPHLVVDTSGDIRPALARVVEEVLD